MKRIDIVKTIEQIDFGPETWEWLDLIGTIAGESQKEAIVQEKGFLADTPYKRYLICTINKDLQTISAIYLLLRCEMIHQAASHVRLLCESLITMRYITLEDQERRALQFWGYMDIEAYKITQSLLEWEGSTAKPTHVEKMKEFKESITQAYENSKIAYSYKDKKTRIRPFSNWCNKKISIQAQDCGPEYKRLYKSVYGQMSAYIHGSAWSLRRQISYSRDHHQPKTVLMDIAAIIRTTAAVWVEWAKFFCEELGWGLEKTILWLPGKIEELEEKHFPIER